MILAFRHPVALATALAIVACAALAQERPIAGETVTESIDVREVSLDVVIEADPGALEELQPSDIALRVDKKKVKVTHVTPGSQLQETIGDRLTVIVVVDSRHLQQAHRAAALHDVSDVLEEEMTSNPTWVTVVNLGQGVELLQAPTRDTAKMRSALAAATVAQSPQSDLIQLQRSAADEVDALLTQLSNSGSAYRVAEASKFAVLTKLRGYGRALAQDVGATLRDLEQVLEALAFVPGPKAMFYLSDGLPLHPLDQVARTLHDRLAGGSRQFEGRDTIDAMAGQELNDRNARPTGSDRADMVRGVTVEQEDDGGAMQFQGEMAALDMTGAFARTTGMANAHRVTFYPLRSEISDAVLAGLADDEERRSATSLTDMSSGLEALAVSTGGTLARGDRDSLRDAFNQARDDLADFYSIGFEPPEGKGTERLHDVVLKVRRKRVEVRYPRHYLRMSMESRLSARAWGALLLNWEVNQHGLEVVTRSRALADGDTEPTEPGLHEVDVMLSLPIGKLTLLGSGPSSSGAFKAVYRLRRVDGARTKPEHVVFAVAIPSDELEAAADQFYAVRSRLELPLGDYEMVVGLWEENTGESSFVLHQLSVGAADEVALLNLPDLAAISTGQALQVF